MSSGGSSPSGTTKYEWNDDMRDRLNNQLNASEVLAHNTLNNGFQRYGGQRYAPLSNNENDAIMDASVLRNSAPNPWGQGGGASAANRQLTDTMGGAYLGSNPFATGGDDADKWTRLTNNYRDTVNDYAGMSSPYFRQMTNQGLEDMSNAYKQGTSADTTRMFNLAGAFGGSAHQNAVANNEAALGKQMGNYLNQMQNAQYDRSAGLEESRIGRGFQSDESALTRGLQGFLAGQDRGAQSWENERNRMTGLVGAGQNEQNMGIDRTNLLMSTGGLQRGVNQQNADFDYQQWIDSQNFPFKTNDWLMGTYGRAMGAGGMNSTLYNSGPSSGQMGMSGLLALASMFG